jgi:hypothetical protein
MTTDYGSTRYPDILVELIGTDGNAFALMGKVRRALKDNGVPATEIAEFTQACIGGDYNHLLSTIMDWVDVA